MAKSIVEAHGGSIRAESQVGCGTAMIITLHPEGRSVTQAVKRPA
jgi:signal transduction histidine kinase